MDGFLQGVGIALIAVVLCCVLAGTRKDISMLLGLAACCMILFAGISYLKPVMELVGTLAQMTSLDATWIGVVLKTVGISLVAQFAGLICADAGNTALSKAVEILAAAAVLWLSIPMMQALLELVQEMTGGL